MSRGPSRLSGDAKLGAANVLFDLDGTLTDSRPGILNTIQHTLREFGIEAPAQDDLLWCIGPPLHDIFRRLLPDGGSIIVERAVTTYVERYHLVGHRENRVYDDVPEMLSAVGANSRLVLVTAKDQDIAERILDVFELRSHFCKVFGSERSGRLADKRELVRYVMDELDLDPADTVIVGDRIHDVVGGRHNGIVTIGAAWGYGTHEEMAEAHHICHSPPEVVSLLKTTA